MVLDEWFGFVVITLSNNLGSSWSYIQYISTVIKSIKGFLENLEKCAQQAPANHKQNDHTAFFYGYNYCSSIQ